MKSVVSKNSYVNAFTDKNEIVILERDEHGNRIIKKEPIEYTYYTLNEYGDHKTIFGERCSLNTTFDRNELRQAIRMHGAENVYETDVNQVFRYLSANYDFDDTPKLKVVVYDIEVEFRAETRYSNPDDAENRIITFAVLHQWSRKKFCVVLVPDNKTIEETEAICKRAEARYDENTSIIVANTEADLLNILFILMEDADVITGWNSESYDFKYIVNRTKRILGEDGVRRLSPVNGLPRERESFNKKTKSFYNIYEPSGIVHLDYMLLYQKYTYIQLTSYSLDNVSYVELDDQKIEYSGNLYDLYLEDLETFIVYNIKDVELVDELDQKLKFIDLTNVLAHSNGVLMQTTLGTVALTEQAIINEGHYYFKEPVVFPNKVQKDDEDDESGAAGAFVVDPKKGVSREVAGIDVESLYPSIIRMLNMSPETLVAHINSDITDAMILDKIETGEAANPAEAWHSFFNTVELDEVINQTDNNVTLEFNRSDEKLVTSGKKIYEMIFSNPNLCISSNGTVFDLSKVGVIPSLLTRWFMERRTLKASLEEWKDKLDKSTTEDEKVECRYWVSYYDQRQHAKKINLNALYGALLNKHCRFYDKRIGQSTTLTGRTITRHMGSEVNKIVVGEYTVDGGAVIYGDSVTSDTTIKTNHGDMTVEQAFNMGERFWNEPQTDKEYSLREGMRVMTFDPTANKAYYGDINYIYRHKTRKQKWRVTDSDGNSVIVTNDHSVMVERDGVMVKVKPCDMVIGDILIGIVQKE